MDFDCMIQYLDTMYMVLHNFFLKKWYFRDFWFIDFKMALSHSRLVGNSGTLGITRSPGMPGYICCMTSLKKKSINIMERNRYFLQFLVANTLNFDWLCVPSLPWTRHIRSWRIDGFPFPPRGLRRTPPRDRLTSGGGPGPDPTRASACTVTSPSVE